MKKNTKLGLGIGGITLLVIAIVLVSTQSPKAPIKDDSYVIYETTYGQVSAKEYYKTLSESQLELAMYAKFEKDILDSMEKDSNVTEVAKQRVKDIKENVQEAELKKMGDELTAMGYNGIEELEGFFANMIYRDHIANQYVNENIDELFPGYAQEFKPRTVSHILIKVEDVTNPTAEEKANLSNIRKRILDGENFADVAKELSVDTSKEQGGALGLMDKNTPYVETFLNAALTQEAGKIYDWVASEHGFHLILVDATDEDTIKKTDGIEMQIVQSVPQVSLTVMNKIINDSGVEFLDDDFKNKIFKIMEGAL